LRPGLTSLPPLRGWSDRFSSGFFHYKILLPVATQSLHADEEFAFRIFQQPVNVMPQPGYKKLI
jgi:hypothetical protein